MYSKNISLVFFRKSAVRYATDMIVYASNRRFITHLK